MTITLLQTASFIVMTVVETNNKKIEKNKNEKEKTIGFPRIGKEETLLKNSAVILVVLRKLFVSI